MKIKLSARQKEIIEAVKSGTFIYLFNQPFMYRLGKMGRAVNWDWMERMIDAGIFETTDSVSLRWNEFTLTEKGRAL